MNTYLRRFLPNEEGTTMTEFVMTLPIFILCFIGVIQLGHFSEISVRTWSKAHRNTFQAAVLPSHARISPHVHPAAGGGLGLGTLGLGAPNSTTGIQKGMYMASEAATYGAMIPRGHWGESYMRARPVNLLVDFQFIDDNMTMNSEDILGGSPLAKDLVDERVGSHSGTGSGALATLNSFVSASGLRPAIAAGMRYGAVGGWSTDSRSFAGRTINTRASFNTLVPPYPLTGFEAKYLPTGVVRLTMENHSPYEEVLGIAWDQPYRSADFGTSNAPGLGFPQ